MVHPGCYYRSFSVDIINYDHEYLLLPNRNASELVINTVRILVQISESSIYSGQLSRV